MTGEGQRSGTGAEAVAAGFRRLFEPLTIGGFTVRNRLVNTTHGTALGDPRDLPYLRARARGGVGLIGVHASFGVASFSVGPGREHRAPEWDEEPLSPTSAEGIAYYDGVAVPYLAQRAELIHGEGARCFAQVYHPGAGRHQVRLAPPVAPSGVLDPYEAVVPHALSTEDIEQLVVAFAHGIRRAHEAGMDAAEIHGAHGYLVHQFLSPYSNRRDDGWGGARANRVRFAAAIVEEARRMVGDFPIGIRVGCDGDGRRGMDSAELAETVGLLEPHVDFVSVSAGSYSGFGAGYELAYVSPWYKEPAYNVEASAAVKARVGVPVIVTGRISDPSIAEGILADGAADMVGMVRALIADPDLPRKARDGRAGEVRMCLGLSECHHIGPDRVPMTCAVNAAAGREEEMQIVPAAVPKTVVVVGAGPAGLEAARVAALRGHRVYLADRSRHLGGTVRRLANDPNRRNLRDHAAYFETQLPKLGVEMVLGNEATADDLAGFGPDAVVVATGGRPLIPDVPGLVGDRVVTALDVLAEHRPALREVVVVVGGYDRHIGGPTVAELLADRGHQVELINEQVDFASGAEDGTRLMLLHRLLNKGVAVSASHRLVEVDAESCTVANTFTGAERRLRGASVVLACGLVADDRLARQLHGRVPQVHLAGDALAPRRIMHATVEGARVANAL